MAGRGVNAMLEAALDYAAKSWPIFPCKWQGENAKAPLTLNGHLNATTDPDQIRAWWTRYPNAMIGAPVHRKVVVLDVDPRNGGSAEDLAPTPTLTCVSGRNDGGMHLYYRRPGGQLVSTRLPKGIDLKANGYCIVPPSIHPVTGQPYRWDTAGEDGIAPLPAHLLGLLQPQVAPVRPMVRRGDGKGLVEFVARATTNVNDALYWAAMRAREDGVLDQLEDDLIAAASDAARTAGTWTPGGERQSRRTVDSARNSLLVGA